MAENDKFGGFDSLVNTFLPSNGESEHIIDPDDIKKAMESLDKDETSEKSKDLDKKESIEKNDEIKQKKDNSTEKDSTNEIDNKSNSLDETNEKDTLEEVEYEESDLVDTFSDLFAEELGWEFEEGEKPKSVKELVEYMQEVIEANSAPKFANDIIKDLNEYVEKGGDLERFYKSIYKSELVTDNLDLTNKDNQKAVIKENLKNRGYSEQRIDKLISRYEETESLEEEANDSLIEVKEYREKTKAELLDKQKKYHEEEVKLQHQFVANVEKIIEDSTDVRGIELSKKEKKELLEYIFKPEKDGATRYQKDYNSNLKNLVESAYFTMKGDKLVQDIQKKATSDATKRLKLKLKTKGTSTKNTAPDNIENNSKVTQLWDIASKELKSF